MREVLTISALARRAGVSSKTLRYWESLGLLPRAARSHTGYRLFDAESLRYVAFVRKSKSLGLTLAEMREALRLARTGQCPCSHVIEWTERRTKSLEQQIESLQSLLTRLKRIQRQWAAEPCPPDPCGEVCGLIEGLPEAKTFKGGKSNAETLVGRSCSPGDAGRHRSAQPGNGCC